MSKLELHKKVGKFMSQLELHKEIDCFFQDSRRRFVIGWIRKIQESYSWHMHPDDPRREKQKIWVAKTFIRLLCWVNGHVYTSFGRVERYEKDCFGRQVKYNSKCWYCRGRAYK